MPHNPPSDDDPGVTQELELDHICVEFEKALQAGASPRIEELLQGKSEPLRSQLLRQLLLLDIEYAQASDIPLELDDLLGRFPTDQELIKQLFDGRGPIIARTEFADSPVQQDSTPSGSSLHGRFEPGQRVAGRYRIVSVLGKGGMGEVYRADDLVLGQAVALKFLPEDFANDAKRLEYFFSEVRLARQVSHPNVCRVHDIGEVDGQHFISMEFIDGEDLKSLLKRTGRPQQEKAIEWSRQLCAGLAAAHEQGVIHRDLKPANVMIDGRGQVRITDFGLATISGDDRSQQSLVGTPAYMAPEQMQRGESSIRSDVYSLGLVLFELFAGVAARDVNSASKADSSSSSHGSLSSVIKDIDPAVEAIVSRCLLQAPSERPATAVEVAMALPGGDPLAAALAAGQVPSPQLVAASEDGVAASPKTIAALLILLGVSLLAACLLSSHGGWIGFANDTQPYGHLLIESREQVRALGHDASEFDASGYDGPLGLRRGPDTEISFWYRQRDVPFVITDHFRDGHLGAYNLSTVTPTQPSWMEGDVGIRLSPKDGTIRWYRSKPIRSGPGHSGDGIQVDPKRLGLSPERVGFDFDDMRVDASADIRPPDFAHAYQTWRGKWPETNQDFHATVASTDGELTYFELRTIENEDVASTAKTLGDVDQSFGSNVGLLGLFIASGIAFALMLNNLRLGHGDKIAALRLSLLWFCAGMLCWSLRAQSFAFVHFKSAFNDFAGSAVVIWVFYISFEPFVRRRWPELLVGTTNLLRGNLLNTGIGRELLAGVSLGSLYVVGILLLHCFMGLFSAGHFIGLGTDAIAGTPLFLSWIIGSTMFSGVFYSIMFLAGGIAWRLVFRTKLWTCLAMTLLLGMVMSNGIPTWAIPFRVAWMGLMMYALFRHGLLALIMFRCVEVQLQGPVTGDVDAEFFARGVLVLSYVFLIGLLGAAIWSGRAQTWFRKFLQRSGVA